MASSAYTHVRNGAAGLGAALLGFVTWKTHNQAQNVSEEHRGPLYKRMSEAAQAVLTSSKIDDPYTAANHVKTVTSLAKKGAACGQAPPDVEYDYDPLNGLSVESLAPNTKELVYSGESNEPVGYANQPLCPCTRVDLIAGRYLRCPAIFPDDVLLVRPQGNNPCDALRAFLSQNANQEWSS